MLTVIDTHPVPYRAPVYRVLQEQFGIPVTVVYGSDYSIAGYHDEEFGLAVKWDTGLDLLSGYRSIFLSRVANGGARSFDEISARGLGKTMRSVEPSAVLLTGYATRFNQSGFYHAWKMQLPILFRAETTDHARRRSRLKSFIRDHTLTFCYRKTSKLLYIGKHSYDHFRRLGSPGEKLVFSPYCVDTAPFRADENGRETLRQETRSRIGLRHDQIAILFSGKLTARKRPDLILEAVKLMPKEIRDRFALIFLGSGEMADSLAQSADADPATQVFFAGFQHQGDLSAFYHAADLFVLPSQESETWGVVVNEALHHGLPCILSDAVGSALDLIGAGKTGFTFRSGSAPELSSALQAATGMLGRAEIRDICRKKVGSYTVEMAAMGIAEAYGSLVEGVGSRELEVAGELDPQLRVPVSSP